MKTKIVLWGQDEKDEKILVALELLARENKVNIYTFTEEQATEVFYNRMMDEWRSDKPLDFPEGHTVLEMPLSVTGELLPENIKVQRTDLISRAKAEWHFVVLSAKLHDMYATELEEMKTKVRSLKEYDNHIWDEMKEFWAKVQGQIYEKNLFREHANQLKEETNYLFDRLKELRSKANEEIEAVSKEKFDYFSNRLEEVLEKVDKGLGLNPIFEELKKMQREFKEETLTRAHRSKLWKKIDDAFKLVKEKKYGKKPGNDGATSRLTRRYQGLMAAIDKMERSISKDKKEIEYQDKKANETDGQLEMQIRQAKIKMIEERINSKSEKLTEMHATRQDLEQRMEKERQKEEVKNQAEKFQEAKEEVKERIADQIKEQTESLSEEAEKLKEAAEAINKKKKKSEKKSEKVPDPESEDQADQEESVLETLGSTVGEALEDVVDTVKAVSEVVSDNVEKKIKTAAKEGDLDKKIEKVKESVEKMAKRVTEKLDEVSDNIKSEEE